MNALIESFFFCLLASMIWAPLVFLGAAKFGSLKSNAAFVNPLEGKIWPAALILAALPVMIAPFAAAFGLSLRTPAPLPPMAEISSVAPMVTDAAIYQAAAAPATVSLADILRMTAILYFYGFMMLAALAAIRHIWFSYRLNFATPIDEPKLEAGLEIWRQRIGVSHRPRYVFSHIVTSVCVYGFFRPIVVMPYNLLDRISIEDAALMGAHEMAHVKRGDVVLFALCSVAKAVFWFNPFMHRICARATLAAEQGADALVLARGVDRRQYAQCFVQGLRLAAGASPGFVGELVPSFTPFDKRSRRARLDAILSGAGETSLLTFGNKVALGTGAVLAAGLAFAQAALAVTPPPAKEALPVTPVEGEVTMGFGAKNKVLGDDRPSHEGVDIRAALGTPVHSAGNGKVIDATDRYQGSEAWGKVVVIDHGHGLVTRYAHLDSYVVRKGDNVKAGDVIASVGATGKATGPHLHFEVLQDGVTIDPAPVVAPVSAPAPVPAAPAVKTKRSVNIVPAPKAVEDAHRAMLEVRAAEIDSELNGRLSEKKRRKMEKKLAQIEEKLRDQFQNFDAFEEFDDIDIRLAGIDAFVDMDGELAGKDFMEAMSNFRVEVPNVIVNARLSEKDMKDIRAAQEEALAAAAKAMERAKTDLARTHAQREAARAQMEASERQIEEQSEQWEREIEARQADHERQMEAFEREAERARARAERNHERMAEEFERIAESEDVLREREEAIRDAMEQLNDELEEIEERRVELAESHENESDVNVEFNWDDEDE